jgi:hypothetical protein
MVDAMRDSVEAVESGESPAEERSRDADELDEIY